MLDRNLRFSSLLSPLSSLLSPLSRHLNLGVSPAVAKATAGVSPFRARYRSVLPLTANAPPPDSASPPLQALHATDRSSE